MNPKDGKKQLIFLEPIHGHQTNTEEVLQRLIKVLEQHGVSVTDDNEESNEIHTKRNSN
jgi:hypothetical protein